VGVDISLLTSLYFQAMVLFGDPSNGDSGKGIPASKVKAVCINGDGVCTGALAINNAHLSCKDERISPAI
jgi:hypothetical protein